MPRRKAPSTPDEILDQLLGGAEARKEPVACASPVAMLANLIGASQV
jgi:hypothetical protein